MWPIGSLLPSDDARLAQRCASRLGPSLAAGEGPNQRPAHFLPAAGVHAKDIVKIRGLASCRHLLLATQSLGVEQYASPTSARLWSTIRDRSTRRDIELPDCICPTRSGVPTGRLVNETLFAAEIGDAREPAVLARTGSCPITLCGLFCCKHTMEQHGAVLDDNSP